MAASIKKELRDRLAAVSAVTAAGYSVYVDRLPESIGSGDRLTILIGRSDVNYHPTLEADTDELVTEEFGIEVRGKTSKDAQDIQEAVVDNLRLLQASNLGSSRRVGAVFIDEIVDSFEADDYQGDAGNSVIIISIRVMHTPQ